jgi:hypothetical protein
MPRIPYKITDVREVPSADPARLGKTDMMISWMEDAFRPFNVTIPLEDYTPEKGLERVRAEVRKHALIVGTEGEEGA